MKTRGFVLVAVLVIAAGCSKSDVARSSGGAERAVVDSRYLADAEPANPMPVGEARASVANEQTVTLVGTIGGSPEPFVDGIAAFTIVDPKVPYCSADEGCPTPWDYCCTQDQVKANIATVKIVDGSGKLVADDARKLLGVRELCTVVVQGKAQRDEQGNLSVAARRVFVRPSE